jgi:alginate O-acetyltransferase complex protein AlgI
MVFSSQVFLFYFLPLALAGNYLLPIRARNLFLTLVSYVFYGWWNPWFVGLMLVSTLIDWYAGLAITAPGASMRQRKAALACALTANLGLLGFFKYFMFAQENVNRLLELFGRQAMPIVQVALPIGISFYTFQSMSYSIDLYRGHARRARTLVDFCCFVSLFPQLVAGPIVRYQDLADQLVDRPQRGELFANGALTFMLGFAKKVLVANTLAEPATLAFDRAADLSPLAAWVGLVAYTFQMYFDFSGYSDMAIGLGKMLGFTFPDNFRAPYKSESFTQFWQRWHITLMTWLRDYVFIPLGGSREGRGKTIRNILIVFFLSGVWHGASWHFVLFGTIWGVVVAAERLTRQRCLWWFLPRPGRIACTFALWTLVFPFFRCADMHAVADYYRALFVGRGSELGRAMAEGALLVPATLVPIAIAAALAFLGRDTKELAEAGTRRVALAGASFGLFAWGVLALFSQAENPFLYFQF